MKLRVHYQTDHMPLEPENNRDVLLYFPETNRNPSKQVDHALELVTKVDFQETDTVTLASDSPYMVSAIECFLRHKATSNGTKCEISCYIDNVFTKGGLNDIFRLFSEPMQRLFIYD